VWIENFLFTRNWLFKHKEVVSNLHVCSNGIGKIWVSCIFQFSTRNLSSTHTEEFKIFFAKYMTRSPTIKFQLSIMPKCLPKHRSTNVSFKITIRKRHIYIDIPWSWIWNQYFYLGIRNDERTKMIVLLSYQLATRLNSQNTYEIVFHNEIWHINLHMNNGISTWHNSIYYRTRLKFLTSYISSLHDYWLPSTWNSLEHKTCSKMERCE